MSNFCTWASFWLDIISFFHFSSDFFFFCWYIIRKFHPAKLVSQTSPFQLERALFASGGSNFDAARDVPRNANWNVYASMQICIWFFHPVRAFLFQSTLNGVSASFSYSSFLMDCIFRYREAASYPCVLLFRSLGSAQHWQMSGTNDVDACRAFLRGKRRLRWKELCRGAWCAFSVACRAAVRFANPKDSGRAVNLISTVAVRVIAPRVLQVDVRNLAAITQYSLRTSLNS